MPNISNLVGRVEFPLTGEDIKCALLNNDIPDCEAYFAKLPGHDGVDVLYIDEFSEEYRWRICQIIMRMFDVFDHDFSAYDYPIQSNLTVSRRQL